MPDTTLFTMNPILPLRKLSLREVPVDYLDLERPTSQTQIFSTSGSQPACTLETPENTMLGPQARLKINLSGGVWASASFLFP